MNPEWVLNGNYAWWGQGFLEVNVAEGRGFLVPPSNAELATQAPLEPLPPTDYLTPTVMIGFRPTSRHVPDQAKSDDFFTKAGYYPWTIMGIVHFDGAGSFKGAFRNCIGGISKPYQTDQPVEGNYTVEPNLQQGLLTTWWVDDEAAKRISGERFFIILDLGNEIKVMNTYSDVTQHRRSIMIATMKRLCHQIPPDVALHPQPRPEPEGRHAGPLG